MARKAVKAGGTSATIKGLKSGKTVYVTMRPMARRGGKTYSGALNGTPRKVKVT